MGSKIFVGFYDVNIRYGECSLAAGRATAQAIAEAGFQSEICNLKSEICNLQSGECNLSNPKCNPKSWECNLKSGLCTHAIYILFCYKIIVLIF